MKTDRPWILRWEYGVLLAVLTTYALGAHAATGGMDVESGKWEMKSTTRNPMTGEPHTVTVTECIEGGSLGAGSFLQGSAQCKVSDLQTGTTSMRWKMTCDTPGGQMQGQAQIRSSESGKKVTGTMQMSASVGGQTLNFSNEWAGRWIGSCSEGAGPSGSPPQIR